MIIHIYSTKFKKKESQKLPTERISLLIAKSETEFGGTNSETVFGQKTQIVYI
jgi:hypothetical protein